MRRLPIFKLLLASIPAAGASASIPPCFDFHFAHPYSTLSNSRFFTGTVGDYDGNGTPDVFFPGPDQDSGQFLLGDGSGAFALSQYSIPISHRFSRSAAGDVDGDGDLDLVIGTQDSPYRLEVYLNDGGGTFSFRSSYNTFEPRNLALEDLDNDDILDLAILARIGAEGAVLVRSGIGNGAFTAADTYAPITGARDVYIADFDNDGSLDFLTGPDISGLLRVFMNDGAGGFTPLPDQIVAAGGFDTAIGDYDRDGRTDLATIDADRETISIISGLGNGSFGAIATYSTGGDAEGLRSADVDNDGDDDLLFSRDDDSHPVLELWRNDGTGSFPDTQTVASDALAYLLERGPHAVDDGFYDLDRDGDLDALLITNVSVSDDRRYHAQALLNRGDGEFFELPTVATGADDPVDVQVADINGDAAPDVVAALHGNGNDGIAIFLNDGSGLLTPPTLIESGRRPWRIALVDLDGDLDRDLVFAASDLRGIIIRRNDGTGSFQPWSFVPLNRSIADIEVGDMNGDGRIDIACTIVDTRIPIIINNPDGTFTRVDSVISASSNSQLTLGDLDGDQDLDVAITRAFPRQLEWLTNDGTGNLSSAGSIDFALGTHPTHIVFAELNGDGLLDLATIVPQIDAVRLFAGDGAGSFQQYTDLPAPGTARSLNAVDVDQDSDIDLILPGMFRNEVYFNDGSGSFPVRRGYRGGRENVDVAVSDLNRDGVLDLVSVDYLDQLDTGGNVRVALGICRESPCPADLTGSSDPNAPDYGVPDGRVDSDDFFYYLDAFVAGTLATCDLTGSSDPNDPTFATPDGDCDASDFFYYLDRFTQGCV